jgi:hypothetical protein
MGKPNMGFPNQAQHFFYQLWAAHQGAMLWAIWTRGYGLQEFAIWILAKWLLCIDWMVTWLCVLLIASWLLVIWLLLWLFIILLGFGFLGFKL